MSAKAFDLNIESILEAWAPHHALREIIANALDEKALTKTKGIEIFPDHQGLWHVRDFGRGLRYEHLTQNECDEKLRNSGLVVGKFGVGLKDALATFDRHNINVEIHSRYGDITLEKAKKYGFEDVSTLHAIIADAQDSAMVGTEFIFKGISESDVRMAKENFVAYSRESILEETRYGQVLLRIGNIAKIFVNGLRVAEEENFIFSYNITSLTANMRKALNRERTNVGRTAYADRIKSILLDCKTQSVAQFLVDDLRGYEMGTIHDELKWTDVSTHAIRLLNEKKETIFLTPSELNLAASDVQHAKDSGLNIVVIPENVKSKVQELNLTGGESIKDLRTFRSEWNAGFEFKFVKEANLTEEERRIFFKTPEILALVGDLPPQIKFVQISETMRIDSWTGVECVGLWDSSLSSIIVKRSQLNELATYAGTLLHELAHAKSGESDMSREFENVLTTFLGIVSRKVFQNL